MLRFDDSEFSYDLFSLIIIIFPYFGEGLLLTRVAVSYSFGESSIHFSWPGLID